MQTKRSFTKLVGALATDFINLMYPNMCLVCGENLLKSEQCICLRCVHEIPKTNFHLQTENPIEKRFWGKVPIFRATAFFYFRKGSPFQKVLHALKYKNDREIGAIMGKYAAVDLLDSADFASVDVIIPVPLHPKKMKVRGYNQSDCIANGLSKILEKPVDTLSLARVRENTTQTKKSVYERYTNTEGIFELRDQTALAGKHVLLVDDVLTTGSTLESCIQALLQCPDIRISVFTLAVA